MIDYVELRKSKRIDLVAAAPLPTPLTLYIEPTSRCNLSCDFCPQSLPEFGPRVDMDMDLYRRLITEAAGMNLKSLKLYFFGEPFLHPNIAEMMTLATSICIRVEITTNGMLLTERNCQALLESGVHYLRVSIYPDARPLLVLTGVRRLWEAREVLGWKLPIICAKVFDTATRKLIEPFYRDVVDEIMVDGLHTIGSEFVRISQQPRDARKACAYPFYNLVVKATGAVVPCCVAWEDSLVVGDANTQTLAEIWAGEPLARIHRLHLDGRRGELAACSKCDTLFGCPDSIDALTVAEYNSRRGL